MLLRVPDPPTALTEFGNSTNFQQRTGQEAKQSPNNDAFLGPRTEAVISSLPNVVLHDLYFKDAPCYQPSGDTGSLGFIICGHYKGIRLYCKGLGYSDAEINRQRSRTSNGVNRIPPPLRSADAKRLKVKLPRNCCFLCHLQLGVTPIVDVSSKSATCYVRTTQIKVRAPCALLTICHHGEPHLRATMLAGRAGNRRTQAPHALSLSGVQN